MADGAWCGGRRSWSSRRRITSVELPRRRFRRLMRFEVAVGHRWQRIEFADRARQRRGEAAVSVPGVPPSSSRRWPRDLRLSHRQPDPGVARGSAQRARRLRRAAVVRASTRRRWSSHSAACKRASASRASISRDEACSCSISHSRCSVTALARVLARRREPFDRLLERSAAVGAPKPDRLSTETQRCAARAVAAVSCVPAVAAARCSVSCKRVACWVTARISAWRTHATARKIRRSIPNQRDPSGDPSEMISWLTSCRGRGRVALQSTPPERSCRSSNRRPPGSSSWQATSQLSPSQGSCRSANSWSSVLRRPRRSAHAAQCSVDRRVPAGLPGFVRAADDRQSRAPAPASRRRTDRMRGR